MHDYDEDATPSLENLDPQWDDRSFFQYWKSLRQTQKSGRRCHSEKSKRSKYNVYNFNLLLLQNPTVINAPRRKIHRTYNHDTTQCIFFVHRHTCTFCLIKIISVMNLSNNTWQSSISSLGVHVVRGYKEGSLGAHLCVKWGC